MRRGRRSCALVRRYGILARKLHCAGMLWRKKVGEVHESKRCLACPLRLPPKYFSSSCSYEEINFTVVQEN